MSWRRCSCNPHLKPALEEAIAQFPLKILGFHSDNGSEFINHVVARLLNKLRIQQTKSRSRQCHAARINDFYRNYLNVYLNFHRPSGLAEIKSDAKGKLEKIYKSYFTPFEAFTGHPTASNSANIVFEFAVAHTEVPPMFKAFFLSKEWMWRAYGGATLLLGLLLAQIKIAVMVNEANKRLYDVLPDAAHHSLSDFYGAIFQILLIGGPTVLIGTIAVYITRKYAFWWREAITFYYIPLWRNVAADIEGASQRIQEDVYRGTKVMEGIGWQIASSIFILVGFVPILWELSRGVQVSVLSAIPGSLVWVAFAVSVGGLGISWLVGSKLPALEYDNQRVEAAFRKELVYGEDDKEIYASEEVLRNQFNDIRANSNRLFLHSAYFDLWKYAYSHTVWIVPFLALSSGLFYGLLTFGVMMQVVDAFSRVNNSLGQFIHNWQMITEVRSICRRLREFKHNLETYQATDKPAQVAYRASGPEKRDTILVLPVKAKLN